MRHSEESRCGGTTKNLEILRLTPQNDVIGKPLGMVIAFKVEKAGQKQKVG